ncbi:golgin subfamily A member 6-like protein 1 [Anabas testudineus]|uniref:golgin subfamily A member 6-like protein 1 n=1 Tax=Anabas testudineus TaxID=64144 RepID=UPI00143D56D5|nr:golgin subfamily A member 6-like protein 1 [Anabas testudineus]
MAERPQLPQGQAATEPSVQMPQQYETTAITGPFPKRSQYQHTPAYRGRYAGTAPRGRSYNNRPAENQYEELRRLRSDLSSANQRIDQLQSQLRTVAQETSSQASQHLRARLEAKDMQFNEERQKFQETSATYESQISNLNHCLQVKDNEILGMNELRDKLAAQLKDETLKVRKQQDQLLEISALAQNNSTMITDLQQKIRELQEELQQKDNENLQLKKDKDSLSEKISQTTVQLWQKEADNSFSEKKWQTKYSSLQEEVSKELAEKHESWITTVKQLEDEKRRLMEENRKLMEEKTELETEKNQLMEEKTELEKEKNQPMEEKTELENEKNQLMEEKPELVEDHKELKDKNKNVSEEQTGLMEEKKNMEEEKTELEQPCLKLQEKSKRSWFLFKKKSEDVAAQTQAETRKREKMEKKLKDKQDKEEQKKKEREEKEKQKMEKKKGKEEKGVWSWRHKKQQCHSNSKVEEEAAGE